MKELPASRATVSTRCAVLLLATRHEQHQICSSSSSSSSPPPPSSPARSLRAIIQGGGSLLLFIPAGSLLRRGENRSSSRSQSLFSLSVHTSHARKSFTHLVAGRWPLSPSLPLANHSKQYIQQQGVNCGCVSLIHLRSTATQND